MKYLGIGYAIFSLQINEEYHIRNNAPFDNNMGCLSEKV